MKLFWSRWKTENVAWASTAGWEVYRTNWLTGEREIHSHGHNQVSAEATRRMLNSVEKKKHPVIH